MHDRWAPVELRFADEPPVSGGARTKGCPDGPPERR
jgi:hypothetical protein